jgi:hypothetical protein
MDDNEREHVMTPPPLDAPDFTRRYLNLADPGLGAEAMSASDDFFAPKERMLNPEPAIFIPGKYDSLGYEFTGSRCVTGTPPIGRSFTTSVLWAKSLGPQTEKLVYKH